MSIKVPALPANVVVIRGKPATETASSDPQHFARLLDEKKNSPVSRDQSAGGGLPQARFQPVKSPVTEQPVDEKNASTDDMDASLLAMLLPFHASSPQDDVVKKEKLTPEDDGDAQPDALPGVVPSVVLKMADPASPVDGLLPADAIQSDTPAIATALVTTEAVTKNAGQQAAPAFTLTAAPVVTTGVPHPTQPAAASPAEQSAAIVPSLPEDLSLKAITLPSGNNLLPVKQDALSKGEEQGGIRPEFPLTPLVVTQQTRNPATASVSSTGLLTQEMGTPAWQQSLGQQVACFTRNGIQHAEMRLHPEELGSLQISLQLKNEQAQLHFVSASHQVRAAIEAAVPHLRTSLAESGIELGQSSVGADSAYNGKNPGQSGQSPRQNFASAHASDNHPPAEEPVAKAIRTVTHNNRINTFA